MGLIRLLLALSVVAGHTDSHYIFKMVGGDVAVESFFIISGFFMAMCYGNYKTKIMFWKSRYLRLYPTYLICSILMLYLVLGGGQFLHRIANTPSPLNIFLFFTNFTIFFQDVTLFLGVNGSHFYLTGNLQSSPPIWSFLFLSPAWSLGLELSFYLLVPFFFSRSMRFMALCMIGSFLIKVALYMNGYSSDPWSYRFFPSELGYFLLGSLTYFNRDRIKRIFPDSFSIFGYIAIISFILIFDLIGANFEVKKICLNILMIFSINGIFVATKDNKLDAFVGNLSYPIYLSHVFVIGYVLPKVPFYIKNSSIVSTLYLFVFVILFATMIYYFVEKPIDLYRKKFKNVSV